TTTLNPSTGTARTTGRGDSRARGLLTPTPPVPPEPPEPGVLPPGAGLGPAAACAPRLRVDAMPTLAILAAGEHARPLWQHRAVPGPGAYRKSACRGPAPIRPLLFRRRSTSRAARE